jgi:hypothetical protein
VMRKKLTVMLMAVMMLVMSAAPALADKGGGGQDGQKDPQPTSPPGNTENASVNAPDDILIGRSNRESHGSPQNGA